MNFFTTSSNELPIVTYLRAWLIFTTCLIGVVALLNILVDPYGIFEIVKVNDLNRVKTRASQRVEAFKRYGVERMHPNALILGNSRAEVGFDPNAAAWPKDLRPVYNRAIPGSGTFAALRAFQNSLCSAHPRLVVIGIEFLDFRTDPADTDSPQISEDDCSYSIREHASAMLTISALLDSLLTVKGQRDPYSPSLTDSGFNPMRDYVGIARREGYGTLFRQKNQENARNWADGPKDIHLRDGSLAPEFRALESLVVRAKRNRIGLRLIIYPYHAQSLVLFYEAGLWSAFETWKREMVKLLDAQNAGDAVELWDFTGFAPYANESVPPDGDTQTEMQWYWEAGHFKKELGDVVLARVFASRDETWGVKLTSNNIERHLNDLRAERDAYLTGHSAEAKRLKELISSVARNEQRDEKGVNSQAPPGRE